MNGTLYGTTKYGGTQQCSLSSGCGTVYEIAPTGAESLLHEFAGAPDGFLPSGPLLSANGLLYGTTAGSGKYGSGTVFVVSPSGAYHIVHSFNAAAMDGAQPDSGLVYYKGAFFGTTPYGGAYGLGVVFKIYAGVESVLYSFKGTGGTAAADGALPSNGVIVVNGVLYGTTVAGGGSGSGFYGKCQGLNVPGATGCGTLYALSTTGTETILHDFGKTSTDGWFPTTGITYAYGKLYGTSEGGGGGVFFQLDLTASTYQSPFVFPSDLGGFPSGLTLMNAVLFGTTFGGNVLGNVNNGSIFVIHPASSVP